MNTNKPVSVGINGDHLIVPFEIYKKIDDEGKKQHCSRSMIIREIVCKELGLPIPICKIASDGSGKDVMLTNRLINRAIKQLCIDGVCGTSKRATILKMCVVNYYDKDKVNTNV